MTTEVSGHPEVGVQLWGSTVSELRERARLAESAGFASITVPDHLTRAPVAPLAACAVMAEATEVAKVGPLVLNNDLRHPCVVAREAAFLADVSGGRFELGMGAGHMRSEYEMIGVQFDRHAVRASRLADSVQIIRGIHTGEPVTLVSGHYTVSDEQCAAPAYPVPILVGGNSQALHSVAASYADWVGLVGFGHKRGGADFGRESAARQVDQIRARAGPRASTLRFHALVQWTEVTNHRWRAAERAAAFLEVPVQVVLDSPYVLIGTAAQVVEQLQRDQSSIGINRWTIFGDHTAHPRLDENASIAEHVAAL